VARVDCSCCFPVTWLMARSVRVEFARSCVMCARAVVITNHSHISFSTYLPHFVGLVSDKTLPFISDQTCLAWNSISLLSGLTKEVVFDIRPMRLSPIPPY